MLVLVTALKMCAAPPHPTPSPLTPWQTRLGAVIAATTVGLLIFGFVGAILGGARIWVGGLRVLLGGWLAMGITYGVGVAFSSANSSSGP